jgi:hypothetical protein
MADLEPEGLKVSFNCREEVFSCVSVFLLQDRKTTTDNLAATLPIEGPVVDAIISATAFVADSYHRMPL